MKFYIKIYIQKSYLMYFINSLWESILLKQLAAVFYEQLAYTKGPTKLFKICASHCYEGTMRRYREGKKQGRKISNPPVAAALFVTR